MSNPRPCIMCGYPKSEHGWNMLHPYEPTKRTKPLRALRVRVPVYYDAHHEPPLTWPPLIDPGTLRRFLDAEAQQAWTDREGFTELQYRYYYSGVANGLHKVYERFCGEAPEGPTAPTRPAGSDQRR